MTTDQNGLIKPPQVSASPPPAKLSGIDNFFAKPSGCFMACAVAIFPFFMLPVGLIGVIGCRDPKAREKAAWLLIGSLVWAGICVMVLVSAARAG